MFLLNIHSNQNPSFFPVKMQQHLTIPFVVIVVKINNNNFISCDFTIETGDGNTNYKVCLSFPGPQPKFNRLSQVY